MISSAHTSILADDKPQTQTQAPWLLWVRTLLVSERNSAALVLSIGALMFLPYLGTLGLWDCWEPHYAEVAREMLVRNDWVYPHWESAYFFSKPVLPLWLMALGLFLTGSEPVGDAYAPLGDLVEWGVRLPFAFLAIATLWAVYRIGSRLKNRSTGLLSAVVLGTSAQFIFIGKQAMVDMPFVAFLTIGLAFFIDAIFSDTDEPAELRHKLWASFGIASAVFSQLAILATKLNQKFELMSLIGAGIIALGFILWIWRMGTRRHCLLVGFYVCAGLASLSKGLAPLALLGPLVLLYMFFAWDFHAIIRSGVLWGAPLFLLVASPWYVALSFFTGRDDEGKTFFERFWIHDNLNRVGSGVHGDRAGLGYFLEQIAYGMFPWVAAVPFALGFAAKNEAANEQQRRIALFVLIWALWCYAFFSFGQTKFHHYILPALPPLAVLVGYWLDWLAESPNRRIHHFAGLILLVVFAVAARDLINTPQHLVNLFTYKYDRAYPREVEPRAYIITIVAGGVGAMLLFYLLKNKSAVLLAFILTGISFGVWISHHHFNMLSPHWSQAHLFKTYYAERREQEPIYAYQLYWRGETFYSRNRTLQIKDTGANERMRQLVDQPGREFIITEQSRFHTLKNVLSPDKRDKLQIIDRSNNKFYLCVVED